MATQEKLLKSLESLQNLITSNQILDSLTRKREKIHLCNFITEAISNSTIKIAPNFSNLLSFTIEILLKLIDDPESDVRMVADESLNRIIKAMNNGNIGKVQVELHKEIKRNGSARSLRAALVRFSQLAYLIRPHKGKLYIVNLIPCIVKITQREEDSIHETLASSLPHMMSALGCFTMDNDIKMLLKCFLNNIKNGATIKQRAAASCILAVCMNCKKSFVFVTYILNNLINLLLPVQDDISSTLILGVLGTLKLIIPCTRSKVIDEEIQGTFGIKVEVSKMSLEIDRLLQVYEICMFYLCHDNHNVVNAALETLNILLQNIPFEMKSALLSSSGLSRSYLFQKNNNQSLKQRSESQSSVATTYVSEDVLPLDGELLESIKPDIEKWIDESKLSIINISYAKVDEYEKSCDKLLHITDTRDSSFEAIDSNDYSNLTIGTISDVLSEPSNSDDGMINTFYKVASSDTFSEKSYLQVVDEKSNFSIIDDDACDNVNIGQYTDKAVPLLYASRLIARSFLLTGVKNGLISDKKVRVTVKNLALTCLSTIVKLFPEALLLHLDKNSVKCRGANQQYVSDVFHFKNHPDPQLRGAVTILISNFIKSISETSDGHIQHWINENVPRYGTYEFTTEYLMNLIYNGLIDESSICVRHSLSAINTCLSSVLCSTECILLKSIFHILPSLSLNTYWLVKVKLLEIICDVSFVQVHYVMGSGEFQNNVIYKILFELLKDEDQRVRSACSKSVVKIIPRLCFPNDGSKETALINKAVDDKCYLLEMLDDIYLDTSIRRKSFIENMPFPFSVIEDILSNNIKDSLSRIIRVLHRYLLKTASKHFIFGCIETLSLLSVHYPTTVYYDSWNCHTNFVVTFENNLFHRSLSIAPMPLTREFPIENSADMLNIYVNMLQYNIFVYDFNLHLNLLRLTGNLFAGRCFKNIKPGGDVNLVDSTELWSMLSDKNLSSVAESFLNHIVKLLNIFSHVIEEVIPTPPQVKTLPNLPSASNLSPLKRRKSDLGDRGKVLSPVKSPEKEDRTEKKDIKTNSLGNFVNIPHYMKIYELVKVAYNNYKITLDVNASENFLTLVKETLNAFSQILEIATLMETRRISEEVLHYLKTVFILDPTSTIECVQQMLKSLFSCNLTSNVGEIITLGDNKNDGNDSCQSGFYGHIFQKPYSVLSNCIKNLHNTNKLDVDGDRTVMGYLHRRDGKKMSWAKGSGTTLANYIKIFEPMVIKSLKQYAVTSNTKLQGTVLQLLSQLVQLRVNYCLLDSDKIFIGCVLKQLEFIDEGQIPLAQHLIPKIFQFLVYLSYDKQHSKCIISVPKLIQLCDGLLASGQPPITHCIPALKPVVEDIFLMRNKSNTIDMKELETTREVLISMLIRLIEYKEVLNLFYVILNESKYCDNTDRWYKWSRQVTEALIPKLKQNKIRVDDVDCFRALKRLIFTIHFDAFKPIDDVVVTLFQDPPTMDDCLVTYERWLGKVLIALLILSQVKEEVFLGKILEMKMEFGFKAICKYRNTNTDPLNVTKIDDFYNGMQPDLIFNRFIFQTIDVFSDRIVQVIKNDENDFITKEFTLFLIYCLHIYQSGTHCKTAINAINLMKNDLELKRYYIDLDKINGNFIKISRHVPVLTFEWCYLLTLLNYDNILFWTSVMQVKQENTKIYKNGYLNLDMIKTGAVIVYCDFLSENLSNEQLKWFLSENIDTIIKFSNEIPVYELIGTIGRKAEISLLLLQSLSFDYRNIELKRKVNVLKIIENINLCAVGNVIKFLIYHLLDTNELAVARLVANLASRKVEYLLTLKIKEVNEHLSREDILDIVHYLVQNKLSKKHETLVSLLNKLCAQFYDLTPIEFKQNKAIDSQHLKAIDLNKNWYLTQIKGNCHNSTAGKEIAELLTQLEYEDLQDVMNSDQFDSRFLKDCFKISKTLVNSCDFKAESHFFKANVNYLLEQIRNLLQKLPPRHYIYNVKDRASTKDEEVYTETMTRLFSNSNLFNDLSHLIPSVILYMESYPKFQFHMFSEESYEEVLHFSIICLESVNYLVNVNNYTIKINFIDLAIRCAELCLKEPTFSHILSSDDKTSWMCSCANSIFIFVKYFLIDENPLPLISLDCLKSNLINSEMWNDAGHACYQISNLILLIEKCTNFNNNTLMSQHLFDNIKSITIALSRTPLINSFALTPPSYLKITDNIELSGKFSTEISPLPIKYLQEVDILEEFVFRMTLLGWTSRQQFEEMWMSLLSVLSATPDSKLDQDELNNIVHAMGLAVRAITTLLIETLYVPIAGNQNLSELLHVSRDNYVDTVSPSLMKLKKIQTHLENEIRNRYDKCLSSVTITNVFEKSNTERQNKSYSYGQLSLEYLLIQSNAVDSSKNQHVLSYIHKRNKMLQDSGLDVNSCLQFLLDLYSQWILQQPPPPLRLLYEIVKSIISISDLFTERSQYSWMLNSCIDLTKNHMIEDDIIHQYLSVGICKAAAVILPDIEMYTSIQKIMSQNLKSSFLPTRTATLHGILYILQSCIINNTVIGGVSEELLLFLPIVTQYIKCNLNESNLLKQSQDHQLLLWSISFYLIEHVGEVHLEQDFVTFVIQDAIDNIKFDRLCSSVYGAIMKALERLVIKQCLSLKLNETLTKLALEKMKERNTLIALPSIQLLITCMYTESAIQLENAEKSNGIIQSNPDNLVQNIEKVTAIFDRIRRGCPFEVEILCNILPTILNDFFPPSDIFTKVIGEFLAPQQRHAKHLSRVVFEVFQKAIEQSQLSLLQEWVVFSLSNFTHSLPLGMSTWCLTCFFISASTNKWLRLMFPYVQSRIGRYEYEDRKMLCIASADFYKNLVFEQKQTFVNTFNKVKDDTDTPFNDLLSSL